MRRAAWSTSRERQQVVCPAAVHAGARAWRQVRVSLDRDFNHGGTVNDDRPVRIALLEPVDDRLASGDARGGCCATPQRSRDVLMAAASLEPDRGDLDHSSPPFSGASIAASAYSSRSSAVGRWWKARDAGTASQGIARASHILYVGRAPTQAARAVQARLDRRRLAEPHARAHTVAPPRPGASPETCSA